MDEALFRMEIRRDFYKMKIANPELTYPECVEKYLDDGFDLEGMEKEARIGFKTAEDQIKEAEDDDCWF